MPDPNIKILKKETYLKAIENSIGTRIFNSLFVVFDDLGKTFDVLNDGEYSCAFFVSGMLFLFKMLGQSCATVDSLKTFLENNEKWQKIDIKKISKGDVILWSKVKHKNGIKNAHIGFALSKKEAISTDYKMKAVAKHDVNFRKIEVVYRFIWE